MCGTYAKYALSLKERRQKVFQTHSTLRAPRKRAVYGIVEKILIAGSAFTKNQI